MTPIEDFAKLIKEFRAKRGLTQAKLAERAGISHGYLSRIEMGMQSPTLEVIERLAAALNLKPAALLMYNTNKERRQRRP
jgi:transcriptional regulator with XRE-family HTH domain